MRKFVAVALALPVVLLSYLARVGNRGSAHNQPASRPASDRSHQARRIAAPSSIPQRPPLLPLKGGRLQLGVVGLGIVFVVGILLVGLPPKPAEGLAPGTYAPLAPQANVLRDNANLSLDAPFQIQFTKPMNEGSVASALKLTPSAQTRMRWDATDQTLSLLPEAHWQANTSYVLDVSSNATDQEGLTLNQPIHNSFVTGDLTVGKIEAVDEVDGLVSPGSAFQLTFTRAVKLSEVLGRFTISPAVDVDITGDDPTDLASTVFTLTPKQELNSDADYTIAFTDGGTDSSGAAIKHIDPLKIHTMTGPEVIRFRPQDGSRSSDTGQPVSVRFSVPMDRNSTAAAFSVTVNGSPVAGTKGWAEGDTVLILSPRYAFKVGSTVIAKVTTAAKSKGGIHLTATVSAKFTIYKPTSRSIGGGGVASRTRPWYPSEVYYFNLMNCTRTGGWVTPGGSCSSVTKHTLPAQNPLRLSAAISDRVSRPYAKYMADRRILDHYAYHDPHWRLCNWGGMCGNAWGENIASPSSSGRPGMIAIELFYQNESWCRCEHYYNIMAPFLHQAGVGVWVTNRTVRVSIDFYG